MRWEDERYVRLYTRDTVTWHMFPWETKALFCLLLRKVDRAGLLELGEHGYAGVSILIGMPMDVVERAIQPLLNASTIEIKETTLVMPNYIEAQESISSSASRQRDSRERRRDLLRQGLHPGQQTRCVYFIQSEHGGPIKIGFAEDVARRIVQLQTSRPDKLVLLAACSAVVNDERRLHQAFDAHREKGEWFTPVEGLVALIKNVALSRSLPSDLSQFVTSHTTGRVTFCDQSPRTVLNRTVPSRTEPIQNQIHSTAEPAAPTELELRQPQSEPPTTHTRIKAAAPTNSRGTRVQATWQPRPETLAWASREGVDGARCVEEFVDFWLTIPGAKGLKLDWDRTFKNRIRALIAEGRAPLLPEKRPSVVVFGARRRSDSDDPITPEQQAEINGLFAKGLG